MDSIAKAVALLIQRVRSFPSCKSSHLLFADVLKSCAGMSDARLGKSLHSQVIKQGHQSCVLLLKALLNMYAKCRAHGECQRLFDETPERDTVTWNILFSCFLGLRNNGQKVIELFNALLAAGNPKPSVVTFAVVLPVCIQSSTQVAGKCIHSYAVKCGMESQPLVGNALLSMYAKCGLVSDAYGVFHRISDKDVVSYNALIAGLAENKLEENAFHLFCEMIKGPVMPNYATMVNALPLCAAVNSAFGFKVGKEMHCYVLRRPELGNETFVLNALLSFYLRVGRTREAEYIFSRMKSRDLVSWNSMIAGYGSNGQCHKALASFREFLYLQMIPPDSVTVISILAVCANLGYLCTGKEIHAYVLRRASLHDHVAVENALVNLYAKCCFPQSALNTFLVAPHVDVISWNTVLDAFAEASLDSQFVELFRSMLKYGVKPDGITLLTAARFWKSLFTLKNIKETHGFSIRSGIMFTDVEATLGNELLDAYAKLGEVDYSLKVFKNLVGKKNEVILNSMNCGYSNDFLHDPAANTTTCCVISENDLKTFYLMMRCYAQNEYPCEAISLFHAIQRLRIRLDATAITTILPVCGQMASVHLLRQCHGYTIRACFEDFHLSAALLDVYSKCGSISSACKLYQSTSEKDIVIFTAMIGGLAMHGLGKEAIKVFQYMLESGVKPDHVVLTAVLSACRHSGLVDEGLAIFKSIRKVHHMQPSIEQYACLVDLMGRQGRTKEAFYLLDGMPNSAHASLWGALLGACRNYHDMSIGHAVADQLLNIQSTDIGNYVVLSNLYAADGKWDEVLEMRRLMKMREMKKPAGCSWVEVGKSMHMFVAGDCFHPERSLIYDALRHLVKHSKEIYWCHRISNTVSSWE